MQPEKTSNIILALSIISALVCGVSSVLHYRGVSFADCVAWISWLAAMLLFAGAYLYPHAAGLLGLNKIRLRNITLFTLLCAVFFITHLWNFDTAPWNMNGLFDDAAWNIYYAGRYIFSGQPFQAAFYDHGIAREVLFHYYITFAFRIFGYNLLTFNISVMMLGFTTYIFTVMLVHTLFKKTAVTVASAVILNFMPLHFIFCFVGQRYAIVPPLMMSSLYFLYRGFGNSRFHTSIGSMLAGLCFAGGIMGKQYIMGLAGALVLFLLLNFKSSFTYKNWQYVKLMLYGFVAASLPMLVYIGYNSGIYFANESSYTAKFLDSLRSNGMEGLAPYIERMKDCFFGHTFHKWFIPDFPLIPKPLYILVVPGIIIAFFKKGYPFAVTSFVPLLGAFISGFSDYRVLMACPLWVILMAYAADFLAAKICRSDLKDMLKYRVPLKVLRSALLAAVICAGLIPCVAYLYKKSLDPYSVYFFAQKDVAVSRYLRDIVAGIEDPQPDFRHNEFKKLSLPEPEYETYICQKLGYAITHTFLYPYGDTKIMSFSNQLPYNLLTSDEILAINRNVVLNLHEDSGDVKLIWEISDKTRPVTDKFKETGIGNGYTMGSSHRGRSFTFYILDIKSLDITRLKKAVRRF